MNKQQKIKHWKNIYAQQQRSGLTIIQFCHDNKINASTFYAWRKRLCDKALGEAFNVEQAYQQGIVNKVC